MEPYTKENLKLETTSLKCLDYSSHVDDGTFVPNSITNASSEISENAEPVIDVVINNVVCNFNVRCHLNLRQIAMNGSNVEYRKANGMVTMKLRNPPCSANMWSSGKITCTGATSEENSKKAARRFARCLQNMGFKVKFTNFRIVNVLGTCTMPFGIKIASFSEKYRPRASYEPELHPGSTFKIKELGAVLKIFSTGSITVTAPNVINVQAAIEQIFHLVYEFRKERSIEETDFPLRQRNKHLFSRQDIKDLGLHEDEAYELLEENDNADCG